MWLWAGGSAQHSAPFAFPWNKTFSSCSSEAAEKHLSTSTHPEPPKPSNPAVLGDKDSPSLMSPSWVSSTFPAFRSLWMILLLCR